MAKENPIDEERRKEKRVKREKKEKRTEKDGVHKSKKEKKEKKQLDVPGVLEPLSVNLETTMTGVTSVDENGDVETMVKPVLPIGALVPFANPLADEKVGKKLLKGVKKATKHRCLKRGVKEVVKFLRKSPSATAAGLEPPGILILAADISPMDVISHIPVLCEDHAVPYIYVTSRAELGAASQTKRPTSVVLITASPGKAAARQKENKKKDKDDKEEDEEDFGAIYKDLMKIVRKAGQDVKI